VKARRNAQATVEVVAEELVPSLTGAPWRRRRPRQDAQPGAVASSTDAAGRDPSTLTGSPIRRAVGYEPPVVKVDQFAAAASAEEVLTMFRRIATVIAAMATAGIAVAVAGCVLTVNAIPLVG
jgi:hypothetical protein